ncbi:MAG: hypothetical protein NTV61_05195 [Candidatus Bathyarchaeota archaeon]|nr:hypothetical protein [Candidatus Bathyarchaeota archaeon]
MASALRLGDSAFKRVKTPADFTRFLKDHLPDSETLIVKADWVGLEEGSTKDVDALRCVIEAAKGRVIVTEGHLLWRKRMLEPKGLPFTVDGVERDWDWLLDGEGWRWLLRNPDWGWFRDGPHWGQAVKEERLYLGKHGFLDLFAECGVEYVNATDEIWAGRVADPGMVREAVESRYPPAFTAKLYGFVPEKLFRHRDAPLVSLSKRKDYQSFTMKNLFGLIPDPVRAWWHGPKDSRLPGSILDINKVYGALFELVGVFETPHGGDSFPRDVGVSRSVAQLDAMLNHVAGYAPEKAAYISSANGMFGAFNDELLREAKSRLGEWFPTPKKVT